MNDRLAKIARDAVLDAYRRGFDAGFNAAITQQIEAEQEQLGIEFMQAKKAVAEVLLAGSAPLPWKDGTRNMGETPTIYQGVNRLCARCGQPIPDGMAVESEGDPGTWEEGKVFLYCSDDCEERH